jgi:hypothetical protein
MILYSTTKSNLRSTRWPCSILASYGNISRAVLIEPRAPRFGGGAECSDESFGHLLNEIDSLAVNRLVNITYELDIFCPHCQKTTSHMRDISKRIVLPPNHGGPHVAEFVTAHESPLEIYKCDQCHATHKDLMRVNRLIRIGEILIIVIGAKFLARGGQAMPDHISFPTYGDRKLEYRRVAQVEHNGGHYWAIALRRDGVYRFNDSHVSREEGGFQHTDTTFMVIYHMTREV